MSKQQKQKQTNNNKTKKKEKIRQLRQGQQGTKDRQQDKWELKTLSRRVENIFVGRALCSALPTTYNLEASNQISQVYPDQGHSLL